MSDNEEKKELGGVLVATVTPFSSSGEGLDLEFIPRHLDFLREGGAHGVVPVGTNGEFPSLTFDEKKQVLRKVSEHRQGLRFVAGISSCCLPEVIGLAGFAADIGADAALVAPPFYYRDADERGIAEFFQRVLESAGLPVILYNIPMYTGFAVSDYLVDRLLGHENLAGIKDTGGDIGRTRELVERYAGLRIFGGSDSLAGEALGVGTAGIISGAANIFPELLRELWNTVEKGSGKARTGEKVRKLSAVLQSCPWVAATKYGLELRGLPATNVRPPQSGLDAGQKKAIMNGLEELGLP